MKYPNALAGIKKILISQYMEIISSVCLVFGGIIALAGAKGESTPLVIIGGSVALVAAVVGVVALIFNLIGLNAARKDEKNFSTAFVFAVLTIIAAVLSAVLTSINPDIADWLTFVSRIFELAVLELSVAGVISLADKLHRDDIAQMGQTLRTMISIIWVIVLVVRIFGNRMDRISNVLDIISSVLELVVYIIFIILLTRTKKMLEEN